MKKVLVLAVVALAVSCGPKEQPQTAATPAEPTQAELLAEGENLVNVLDCHGCHSPKVMTEQGPAPDPSKLLSGHPAGEALPPVPQDANGWVLMSMGLTATVGPWGTTYSANITPHETGIGNWTEAQFVKAIREGKYKGMDGSRPLLPPMPWQAYSKLSDRQLKAIYTYLMSLPAVDNLVPAAQLVQHG